VRLDERSSPAGPADGPGQSRVKSLTVTINAVQPETAERIYSWSSTGDAVDRPGSGQDPAGEPVGGAFECHRDGPACKGELGISPGVNDEDLALVAKRAGELGADIMNVLPLIPQGEFSG